MTDKLTALIAELESAKEGSRELDCQIAVHPDTPQIGVVKGGDMEETIKILLGPRTFGITSPEIEADILEYLPSTQADYMCIPHFTTNLQHAVETVPEGWAIAEMKQWPEETKLVLWCPVNARLGYRYRSKAATPALALCIAILKALQEQTPEDQSHDG